MKQFKEILMTVYSELSNNKNGLKKSQLLKAIKGDESDLSKYEYYYYHWVLLTLKKHHFIWYTGDDVDLYSSDLVMYLGFKGMGSNQDDFIKYAFEALMTE
jgi:hypothetical protein